MYLNVVCLKCGKTIPFQSKVPYSVDKVVDDWNLISDETNGEIISIRGTEIASICSQDVKKIEESKADARKKKAAEIATQRGERTKKFKASTQKS